MGIFVKSNLLLYKMTNADRARDVLAAAETALRLDPALSGAFFPVSAAEEMLGRCDRAQAAVEQAMRISPRDPDLGRWHTVIAREQFCVGHFDEAINEAREGIDGGYRNQIGYVDLGAAYAGAGKEEEARNAIAEAKKLNPAVSIKWFHIHVPSFIDNPPGFIDAARKAGLPEE